jgi:hypothetical protein
MKGLEAVDLLPVCLGAGCHALQALFGRQVEDQRQIGPGGADDDALQRVHRRDGDTTGGALIGARGIVEAVADHPAAARQSGADGEFEMGIARHIEEQRLAHRAEALGLTGE